MTEPIKRASTRPIPASSGILDNRERGSVADFLTANVTPGAALAVVSAYFTIYAYYALRESLDGVSMQFLFGEPRFLSSVDPHKSAKRSFKLEDEGLTLTNRLEQSHIAKACAQWLADKVEIRSVKQAGLLHGKLYHIERPGGRVDAVVGSSNFTMRGLGLAGSRNNIELNLEVQDRRDLVDLKRWFGELWQNEALTEDVKGEVLGYLAQLYANHSPEFIYYKTIYHLFGQFVDEQEGFDLLDQSHLVDSGIWQMLFEFQRDGAKGAINKLLKHGGCILADSVGLGKTFTALAVIKYFELRNYRVLVLCPKKLTENWTIYQAQNNSELNPFVRDRFSYTVLAHTDLSRDGGYSGHINLANLNWGAFDLVVIDESHNFRNNTPGKRDEDGNIIRQSRYGRLMDEIIRQGVKTKVLLLSATPVNNDLADLRNQLYIITEGRDSAFRESLGIGSLQSTLAAAQRAFNEWAKQQDHRTERLLETLSSSFFKLLDELSIARSRKHLERYYPEAMAQLGGFPKRLRPLASYSDIDTLERFMTYDKLEREISEYRLALYNPSRYLLPQYQERYEGRIRNFSQAQREHYLIGMMKVNFLKRLESSVCSFAVTMERTVQKIDALITRLERFQAQQTENFEVDLAELEPEAFEDEELQSALQVGKGLKFNVAHLAVDAWLKDLKEDRRQLHNLYLSARDVGPERDAKLAELKRLISAKVASPTTTKQGEPNRKVLVFTAFADTAAYLYEQLQPWASTELKVHSALVVGSGYNRTTYGKRDYHHILTNFSPRAKRRAQMPSLPQDAEIDLLIATDCISEGQNLQDCDYLINYDIHWNPVRIIQRFGRIDRIGSQSASVQLVNFWPTEDLNQYLNLKDRVEARMALVDLSATFEDNLLKTEELEGLVKDELHYRDRQLLRLRDEVLDLEEFSETVSLSEFTLNDFRNDLMNYLQANRHTLEGAPLGLYAVVPSPIEHIVIRPGVIFCLEQKPRDDDKEGNMAINPLHPYYLVYVRDDGEVRFTFTHPKQILDIYRLLCAGQDRAFDTLCKLFDQETADGTEMSRYHQLVEAAVASLAETYQHRVSSVLKQRGGILPSKEEQLSKATDFELITWLVIKEEVAARG